MNSKRLRTSIPSHSSRSRPSTTALFLQIATSPPLIRPPQSQPQPQTNQQQQQQRIVSNPQQGLQSYGGGFYFVNPNKAQINPAQTNLLPSRRVIGHTNKQVLPSPQLATNYLSVVKHMSPMSRRSAGTGMFLPIDLFSSETSSKDSYLIHNLHIPSTPLTGTRF